MIDTLQIFQELQEVLPPEAARRVAEVMGRVYTELQQGITRAEFQELQQTIAKLTEVQLQTNQQLQALAQQVQALAEAQRRTEQQVQALAEAQQRMDQQLQALTVQVQALAEAQRRTEQQVQALAEAQQRMDQQLQALTVQVQALTEAQRRTEQQVQALTEAQRRTEQQVQALADAQRQVEEQLQKLAEAQHRTEAEVLSLSRSIKELTGELRDTRQQLGGLAMTVGYTLENEAFKALPKLLARDFGLTVHGPLRRKYVIDREGGPLEVNIVGSASQNGETVTIVGEAKVQLSKNDVDRFIRKKLKRLEGALPGRLFPVLVTHMTTAADVEAYARSKGVVVYYSYDF